MKPKNLIPLLVVLVVLAGLVLIRDMSEETASLTEQVEFKSLLPAELDADAIAKIDMWSGGAADDHVVLEKSEGAWRVASHFNALAKPDKMDEYLGTLSSLQGEFRATVGEDELADYKLSEETAFHVIGYGADNGQLFYLKSGKGPDFGQAFMRAGDASDVYVVDQNLRREAAIYSTEVNEPPKADTWLDKDILRVDESKVTRLALTYPDKQVTFEYREKPAAADSDDTADEAAPEYEWVAVSGGTGEAPHQEAFAALTRKLSNLRAMNVVDPALAAENKVDPPAYQLAVTVDGEEIVLAAGRPEPKGRGYLRVASSSENTLYETTEYEFDQIFPKGSSFFEMPGLLLEDADGATIEYSTEDGTVRLSKADDAWTVTAPKADLPLDDADVNDLARKVLSWKADDYADNANAAGLDTPARTVTYTSDDESHTIAVGNASQHMEGFYARMDGGERVLVMTKTDADTIFLEPRDLYRQTLFDLAGADVESVTLERGDDSIFLDKEEGVWRVISESDTKDGDAAAIGSLTAAVMNLQADDFVFAGGAVEAEVLGSVSFGLADEASYTLTIHAEEDGTHTATLDGVQTPYVFSAASVARILPDFATLSMAEEEAETADEDPTSEAAESAADHGHEH